MVGGAAAGSVIKNARTGLKLAVGITSSIIGRRSLIESIVRGMKTMSESEGALTSHIDLAVRTIAIRGESGSEKNSGGLYNEKRKTNEGPVELSMSLRPTASIKWPVRVELPVFVRLYLTR